MIFKDKSDYEKNCESKINELCGKHSYNDKFIQLKKEHAVTDIFTTYIKIILKNECKNGTLLFDDIEARLIELLKLDSKTLEHDIRIQKKLDTSKFKTQEDIVEVMGETYSELFNIKIADYQLIKNYDGGKGSLSKKEFKEKRKLLKEQEKGLKRKLKDEEKQAKLEEKELKRKLKDEEKQAKLEEKELKRKLKDEEKQAKLEEKELKRKLKDEEKQAKLEEKELKKKKKEEEKQINLEKKKSEVYESYNFFEGVRAKVIFPDKVTSVKRIDHSLERMYVTDKWGKVGLAIPDEFVQVEHNRSMNTIVQVTQKGVVIKNGQKDGRDLRIPYENIVKVVDTNKGNNNLILIENQIITVMIENKSFISTSELKLAKAHFKDVINQRASGSKNDSEKGWGMNNEKNEEKTKDIIPFLVPLSVTIIGDESEEKIKENVYFFPITFKDTIKPYDLINDLTVSKKLLKLVLFKEDGSHYDDDEFFSKFPDEAIKSLIDKIIGFSIDFNNDENLKKIVKTYFKRYDLLVQGLLTYDEFKLLSDYYWEKIMASECYQKHS